MTIEIRDAALEARLQKHLKSTGSRSVEELLLHLLETQEEQDRRLSDNREAGAPDVGFTSGSSPWLLPIKATHVILF